MGLRSLGCRDGLWQEEKTAVHRFRWESSQRLLRLIYHLQEVLSEVMRAELPELSGWTRFGYSLARLQFTDGSYHFRGRKLHWLRNPRTKKFLLATEGIPEVLEYRFKLFPAIK